MADQVLNVISISISIYGSLRRGSYNAALARALPSYAPAGMEITPAPMWDTFPIYNQDVQEQSGFPAAVETLGDAVRAADGVIICTPEYNFGIPGGLKNALDWVSRLPNQPFKDKPVALQSASPSPVGGARVQYQMRQAMVFLEANVFNKPEIFVALAKNRFDVKTLELTDEPTINFIKQQLAGFEKFIRRFSG